ncbi:MAG: REP-associated tyrosine transposase [Stenotrophobium sp.]
MPNYIRATNPGATYFFTVALADRSSRLLVDRIDTLRSAFRSERQKHPFSIDAIVVLPDHLHCLWTLPPDDADFPNRWRRIKAAFSHALPKTEPRSESRLKQGERGIWQRRYWEHLIRDERDHAAHVDYIHFNPVKHGHVTQVMDWPHSSFHRFVREGVLSGDWGGSGNLEWVVGERD